MKNILLIISAFFSINANLYGQYSVGFESGINITSSSAQNIEKDNKPSSYFGIPIEVKFNAKSSLIFKTSFTKNKDKLKDIYYSTKASDYWYLEYYKIPKYKEVIIYTEISFIRFSLLYSRQFNYGKRFYSKLNIGGGIGVVSYFKAKVKEEYFLEPIVELAEINNTNYNREKTELYLEYGATLGFKLTNKLHLTLSNTAILGMQNMNKDETPIVKNLFEGYIADSNPIGYNSYNFGFNLGLVFRYIVVP